MDRKKKSMFFALLRSVICGDQLNDDDKAQITDEMTQQMIAISGKHDIAHLLVYALQTNGALSAQNRHWERDLFQSIFRYQQLNYEYESLCACLESLGVPFIPLKGSVIRQLYPEPWMRTSCDIDILVHREDIEQITNDLVENHGFVNQGEGSHDISLLSPNKIHIELHYDLIEKGLAAASSELLESVWDFAVQKNGYRYWHELKDEMFYFYHIAHMAKHFESGGCGIRTFIDLWLLDRMEGVDHDKRNELLKSGSLLQFADVARALSKVWFEDRDHSEITAQMEQYIFRGGLYGSLDNQVLVQQQKKGGKIKYICSKLFIPYDVIKFIYPVLQKHRWLTPFMEVHRWFSLLFSKRSKHVFREIRYNQNVSNHESERIQIFLKNIGL